MNKYLNTVKKILIFICVILFMFLAVSCDLNDSGSTPDLVSIKVSNYKAEYKYGEDFTKDGIVVVKVFSDESEEIAIESEYEIDSSLFNKTVAGDYVIVIKLKANKNLKSEFTVKVLPVEDEKDGSKWSDILWG